MFKSLFTISSLTLLSRILGFLRQLAIGGIIGANYVTDAFWIAFRIPNLFRRLLAEGAFHAAFIPLLQGKYKKGQKEHDEFIGDIFLSLSSFLIILISFVMIFTPLTLMVISAGFVDDLQKYNLTIIFVRIMIPYIGFMSLLGIVTGVLNAHKKFILSSLAPVLLNIVFLSVLIVFAKTESEKLGLYLCIGVLFAGFLQLLCVFFGMLNLHIYKENKFSYKLSLQRLFKNIYAFLKVGTPGFIAAGALQINVIVGSNIASYQDGAVSWLFNADQLYQLPLALIGIALGIVLLPELSQNIKDENYEKANITLNNSIILAVALSLPCMVGLFFCAKLIIFSLYSDLISDVLLIVGIEKSNYTEYAVENTALALKVFAIGLPFFILKKVLSPAFFAREDTKTPMKAALFSIFINITLAIILFKKIGFVAIPLATVIASIIETIMLYFLLLKMKFFKIKDYFIKKIILLVLINISLSGLVFLLMSKISLINDFFFNQTYLSLFLIIIMAIIFYSILLYIFKFFTMVKKIKKGKIN